MGENESRCFKMGKDESRWDKMGQDWSTRVTGQDGLRRVKTRALRQVKMVQEGSRRVPMG